MKYNEEKHELIVKLFADRFDDVVKRFDAVESKLAKCNDVIMANDGALRVLANAITEVNKQQYKNKKNARNRVFSNPPPLPELVSSSSSAIP